MLAGCGDGMVVVLVLQTAAVQSGAALVRRGVERFLSRAGEVGMTQAESLYSNNF